MYSATKGTAEELEAAKTAAILEGYGPFRRILW